MVVDSFLRLRCCSCSHSGYENSGDRGWLLLELWGELDSVAGDIDLLEVDFMQFVRVVLGVSKCLFQHVFGFPSYILCSCLVKAFLNLATFQNSQNGVLNSELCNKARNSRLYCKTTSVKKVSVVSVVTHDIVSCVFGTVGVPVLMVALGCCVTHWCLISVHHMPDTACLIRAVLAGMQAWAAPVVLRVYTSRAITAVPRQLPTHID